MFKNAVHYGIKDGLDTEHIIKDQIRLTVSLLADELPKEKHSAFDEFYSKSAELAYNQALKEVKTKLGVE